MKKRAQELDHGFEEIKHIGKMLEKEGGTSGECSKFVFMATVLLCIEDSLRMICNALFILTGCMIGKFLSGLF